MPQHVAAESDSAQEQAAAPAPPALAPGRPEVARRLAARIGNQAFTQAVLAASGELVGDVSLAWRSAEHRQGEIGYLFDPAHAGNGYATEASREMLRLGFEGLGLHRIIGKLDARNQPSARVLERLGMRLEARMLQNEFVKGEWTDEVTYALLEHEWRS